jgi:hypothetical protein
MMMKSTRTMPLIVATLAGLVVLGAAVGRSSAQPPPAESEPEQPTAETEPRLRGELPAKPRKVTVKLVDASVAEALQAVCAQAGWGLVFTGAEASAERKITLGLKRRPATEVIELILETGDLEAELKPGSLLFVKPAPGPAPAPAEPEAATEPAPVAGAPATADDADAGVPDPTAGVIPIVATVDTKNGKVQVQTKLPSHKDDRVQMGKSLRIEAGEEVNDAVVIGGTLTIAGHVRGDAAVMGGSVIVEPGGVVDGDVAAMGGAIEVKPGGVVHGDKASFGGPVGEVIGGLALSSMRDHHISGGGYLFDVFAKLLRAAILFVMALLFISFMPERHNRVRDYMIERPGKSVLAGVIMLIAIVPVCVLFAITVIGIPLIPVLFLFLLALIVVGLAAFLTWIGDRIPVFADRKTPVVALAIGLVLFFIVSIVPVAGAIIVAAVSFFGAGAALLSRFGSEPKVKPAPDPEPAAS